MFLNAAHSLEINPVYLVNPVKTSSIAGFGLKQTLGCGTLTGMITVVEAVYEGGCIRFLEPLPCANTPA